MLMSSAASAAAIGLLAILVSPAEGATPQVGRAAKTQILFRCDTDTVFGLQRGSDAKDSLTPQYTVSARRKAAGEVQLSIDTGRQAVMLSIRAEGAPAHTYVLRDVEQGSSPGSGTSHRADTVIRGRSGDATFTLFASYENGDDEDAALQVEGRAATLLVCAGGRYRVGNAVPRDGQGISTNIYTLGWRSGWAVPMRSLPAEPEFDTRR
jgi:hypothetical protein